ncbi:unnamed protein product [Caenorhabditis angaria]|uniref:C6 domain-containing protein n=1 Tax=Caenorhabditis angaria TaxID=860376 RepID=A0A9P1N5S7_9PELO|nr:unnamed protein product [Caenorhabditis angaria]
MNSLIFLSFFIFISKSNCCIRTQSSTAIVAETCDMSITNTNQESDVGTNSLQADGTLSVQCVDTIGNHFVQITNYVDTLCGEISLTCSGTTWMYESESVTQYYCSSDSCTP